MAMFVSARTGEGLSRLATAVSDALSHHFLDVDVETDVANGRLLAYLAKNGEILSRTYADQRVSVHCRIPRKYLGQIASEDARVNLRGVGHDNARNGSAFSNGHSAANDDSDVAEIEIKIDEVA
jgi:GTP-binding protein HflX